MAIDVNEQNEVALGFYLHCGFEVTGRSAVDGLGKPSRCCTCALRRIRPHNPAGKRHMSGRETFA